MVIKIIWYSIKMLHQIVCMQTEMTDFYKVLNEKPTVNPIVLKNSWSKLRTKPVISSTCWKAQASVPLNTSHFYSPEFIDPFAWRRDFFRNRIVIAYTKPKKGIKSIRTITISFRRLREISFQLLKVTFVDKHLISCSYFQGQSFAQRVFQKL